MRNQRTSRPPVVTAIDLHSNSAVIVTYNRHSDLFILSKEARCWSYKNDLFRRILDVLKDSPAKATVVVEAGSTSRALVLYLRANGYDARMVKPLKPDNDQPSNDWKDARTLAVDYATGKIAEVHLLDQTIYELREMNRMAIATRDRATEAILELQSLVNSHTGQNFSGFEKNLPSNVQLREWLGNTNALRVAMDLRQQFQMLDEQATELRRRVISQIRRNRTFGLLKTIPGVGKYQAATILLETGDIDRFENAGQFHSFTGLMNQKSFSNRKVKRHHKTAGNTNLKRAFSLAVKKCVEWSSDRFLAPQHFYLRKHDQTNSHMLAQQALASKLAKAAYFVMKLQVPFSYERCFGPELMEQIDA